MPPNVTLTPGKFTLIGWRRGNRCVMKTHCVTPACLLKPMNFLLNECGAMDQIVRNGSFKQGFLQIAKCAKLVSSFHYTPANECWSRVYRSHQMVGWLVGFQKFVEWINSTYLRFARKLDTHDQRVDGGWELCAPGHVCSGCILISFVIALVSSNSINLRGKLIHLSVRASVLWFKECERFVSYACPGLKFLGLYTRSSNSHGQCCIQPLKLIQGSSLFLT